MLEHGLNTGTTNYDGLRAHLVNTSGEVVSAAPVKPDGTYELFSNSNGTYSIILSTQEKPEGSLLSAATLTHGWAFTGTNIGG